MRDGQVDELGGLQDRDLYGIIGCIGRDGVCVCHLQRYLGLKGREGKGREGKGGVRI